MNINDVISGRIPIQDDDSSGVMEGVSPGRPGDDDCDLTDSGYWKRKLRLKSDTEKQKKKEEKKAKEDEKKKIKEEVWYPVNFFCCCLKGQELCNPHLACIHF